MMKKVLFALTFCFALSNLWAQQQVSFGMQAGIKKDKPKVYAYAENDTWEEIELRLDENPAVVRIRQADSKEAKSYKIVKKSPQGVTYVLENGITAISLKYAKNRNEEPILIQHDQTGRARVYTLKKATEAKSTETVE